MALRSPRHAPAGASAVRARRGWRHGRAQAEPRVGAATLEARLPAATPGARLNLAPTQRPAAADAFAWPSVGVPLELARVPPPIWYTDPEFAKLEEERIFSATWQYAGPLREPGDYFTGFLLGRGFVVVMNDERQVVAYHNICSHRAAAVATGEGRVPVSDAPAVGSSGLRFECPYHAWQFDLAGRLRGCRISHGLAGIRDFTPETSGLTPIRADVWGPLVFLHWGDNELPPVAEALGAGGAALAAEGVTAEDWVHHKRVDYPMACNWKCMTDNYMDGNYHLYTAHPGLIGCFAMRDNSNRLFDAVAQLCGPNERPEQWPAEGQPGGPLHHQMLTRTRGGVDQSYSCLYPNTFINRYGEWMSVTNVQGACLTTFDLFFKPATLADTAFVAMAEVAEDELQNQDIDLCLRVSANLRSPKYAAGRYAPIESPMWWHHQLLHRSLFGTAPGLRHHPADAAMNKVYYTA